MIDEKEKQRQIEIQRYNNTLLVLIVKSFIYVVHHFICKKKILLLSRLTFFKHI